MQLRGRSFLVSAHCQICNAPAQMYSLILQEQHNAEVPSYVTICQPEDLVIKSIDFTNLPSVSFLSQIDAPLCEFEEQRKVSDTWC